MLGTRYEEYSHFEENLPFKFLQGIKITSDTYSQEANWHDNLEIQYCKEGKGFVMMDEKNLPLSEGHTAVVNSNVLHHTNTDDTIIYDCLIIDTGFCRQMDIDPLLIQFEPAFQSEYFSDIFRRIDKMFGNTNDSCRVMRLCSLILDLLMDLKENHRVSENVHTIKNRPFEAIKETIKFIRTNYERKLSLDEIAQNAAMDKYSLSREFKKLTGKTVIEYINSFRCKKASEHIAEGAPVSDAARMCGFTNMSFFTRTFRKYMGCLPSAYKVTEVTCTF